VVLVVGANDTVNPAARHDKTSAIYGMPPSSMWTGQARIGHQRSMNPGFAGIEKRAFTTTTRRSCSLATPRPMVAEIVKQVGAQSPVTA